MKLDANIARYMQPRVNIMVSVFGTFVMYYTRFRTTLVTSTGCTKL